MKRRNFLAGLPVAAVLSALALKRSAVAKLIHGLSASNSSPSLVACHIGFRPDAEKRLIVRAPGAALPTQLTLRCPSGRRISVPIEPAPSLELDPSAIAIKLPNLTETGDYQASFGTSSTLPFCVRPGVWTQITPLLTAYQRTQRCGHSNRRDHPTCHLDDARRRDNQQHVDTTGGWHDAGDLRKWTDSTLMNLFGLLALARNLAGGKSTLPLTMEALLDEGRYGNLFFLKMQDADGLVWSDVGGGIKGDNSDNHWTDNVAGTADDRWINTEKRTSVQAMFVAAQAMMAETLSSRDAPYAATCLSAAARCWAASSRTASNTTDIAWWVIAATEMYRNTQRPECRSELIRLADQLANAQITKPPSDDTSVHGYYVMWPGNQEPLRDPTHSGLPAYALLKAAEALSAMQPGNANSAKWERSARIYLDDYAAPMAARSAYGIVPFGVFLNAPSDENYRSLGGNYSYRFFMPTKHADWWVGINAHLLSHSLLFAQAHRHFGETSYRDLAYRQLEWVFGANPFGASLVTGIGRNAPAPFSKFIGPINGGIMNGIGGDQQDNPSLDPHNPENWRLNEYWSNHVGYCQWAISVLEA